MINFPVWNKICFEKAFDSCFLYKLHQKGKRNSNLFEKSLNILRNFLNHPAETLVFLTLLLGGVRDCPELPLSFVFTSPHPSALPRIVSLPKERN